MQLLRLLTSEELAFLQELQDATRTGSNCSLQSPSLRLEGGTQTKALLTSLAATDQLTIEAHFNGERVTFPLQLIEDDFHSLMLELGAPQVVEQGPSERPWRLELKRPVELLDEDGSPSGIRLHELSSTGMLIDLPYQPAPQKLALWLPIEQGEPIKLQGVLARKTDQSLVAYRLIVRKSTNSRRLNQFIFQQHRLLNPVPLLFK